MNQSGEQLPIGFDRHELDPSRRLLNPGIARRVGFEEFYDVAIGSRVISMPQGGQEARYHEELHEERLPVFSGMYRDEGLFLLVPEATRTLHKALPLISRDLKSYGEIFFELGRAMGQLDGSSFGLPESFSDRSILDGIAFSLDDSAAYGGRIYLIPPYRLDPMKPSDRVVHRDQVVDAVYEELRHSRYLSQEAALRLTEMMVTGWQEELYRQHSEQQDG
jgi:hypothetical protein